MMSHDIVQLPFSQRHLKLVSQTGNKITGSSVFAWRRHEKKQLESKASSGGWERRGIIGELGAVTTRALACTI